jgi:hypothetical protein
VVQEMSLLQAGLLELSHLHLMLHIAVPACAATHLFDVGNIGKHYPNDIGSLLVSD